MTALPHLAGLPEGMPTVTTPGFRTTQLVVANAVRHGEIAAITGEAGLGKTFAVTHAVARSTVPSVRIQVGPAPTPKEVCARLLKALTGKWQEGTLYKLTDSIVADLSEDPHIVVIDEAQNLDKKGLDQVRLIHDLSDNGFPLLLVGGRSCATRLQSDPQLADRIGGWVEFRSIRGADLVKTLSGYHSLFANTDQHLLHSLNEHYAQGVFRRWARLLKNGLELAAKTDMPDRLTERVASALLAMVAAPSGAGR